MSENSKRSRASSLKVGTSSDLDRHSMRRITQKIELTTDGPVNYRARYESPIGPLFLLSNGRSLLEIAFEQPSKESQEDLKAEPFPMTMAQLEEYFAGTRSAFEIPTAPRGTNFQLRAWNELSKIPFGSTISYKTQAALIGSGPRAVGLANGQNPLPIIVPCHRVIGVQGDLVGYGGGLDRKRALLLFEALVRDFGPQPFPIHEA